MLWGSAGWCILPVTPGRVAACQESSSTTDEQDYRPLQDIQYFTSIHPTENTDTNTKTNTNTNTNTNRESSSNSDEQDYHPLQYIQYPPTPNQWILVLFQNSDQNTNKYKYKLIMKQHWQAGFLPLQDIQYFKFSIQHQAWKKTQEKHP